MGVERYLGCVKEEMLREKGFSRCAVLDLVAVVKCC